MKPKHTNCDVVVVESWSGYRDERRVEFREWVGKAKLSVELILGETNSICPQYPELFR